MAFPEPRAHVECVKGKDGHMAVFEGVGQPVGMPHKKDHKMAKVYRRTYSINKVIEDLLKKEKICSGNIHHSLY